MSFAIETSGPMYYRAQYKYRLERALSVRTSLTGMAYIIPSLDGGPPWTRLEDNGWMHFRAGYCYDGPSGPTIDTPCGMRPAAAHDSPYQAARLGKLFGDDTRELVDRFFKRFLLHDGMDEERAELWYRGVREFAGFAWQPKLEQVHEAPSGRVIELRPGSTLAAQLGFA